MSKNVIIYCRVSSDEQALGTSLEYQEARLREYCLRNQLNIVECYKEDYRDQRIFLRGIIKFFIFAGKRQC